MKINRLRLLGFKSFVEPTDLVIEAGLTGVVGPNGCGKSNLVEALRWVMGESSYKNMRASGMDDVIFSGSLNRPARNTAEVSLVLDNADRTAPAAFNDAEALEVTRRIERAMTLLRRGDLSVTEVCFAVGCSSLGTFSSRFTELVGMPPSTYRRNAAGATAGASCAATPASGTAAPDSVVVAAS